MTGKGARGEYDARDQSGRGVLVEFAMLWLMTEVESRRDKNINQEELIESASTRTRPKTNSDIVGPVRKIFCDACFPLIYVGWVTAFKGHRGYAIAMLIKLKL